jgi:hypothetical protein
MAAASVGAAAYNTVINTVIKENFCKFQKTVWKIEKRKSLENR